MRKANPGLQFDLADSASVRCYDCAFWVCVGCQQAPMDDIFRFCDRCGAGIAAEAEIAGW